jgi:hypothetical protein
VPIENELPIKTSYAMMSSKTMHFDADKYWQENYGHLSASGAHAFESDTYWRDNMEKVASGKAVKAEIILEELEKNTLYSTAVDIAFGPSTAASCITPARITETDKDKRKAAIDAQIKRIADLNSRCSDALDGIEAILLTQARVETPRENTVVSVTVTNKITQQERRILALSREINPAVEQTPIQPPDPNPGYKPK